MLRIVSHGHTLDDFIDHAEFDMQIDEDDLECYSTYFRLLQSSDAFVEYLPKMVRVVQEYAGMYDNPDDDDDDDEYEYSSRTIDYLDDMEEEHTNEINYLRGLHPGDHEICFMDIYYFTVALLDYLAPTIDEIWFTEVAEITLLRDRIMIYFD